MWGCEDVRILYVKIKPAFILESHHFTWLHDFKHINSSPCLYSMWTEAYAIWVSYMFKREKCAVRQQMGDKNKDWMLIDWANVSVGHSKAATVFAFKLRAYSFLSTLGWNGRCSNTEKLHTSPLCKLKKNKKAIRFSTQQNAPENEAKTEPCKI